MSLEKNLTTIKRFITGKLNRSGLQGYVVGLSGGIDSAVSCVLAVEAVGADKVLALMMPYKSSSESSVKDAEKLVESLGISSRLIDISPMVDSYFREITDELKIRAGNKMARERMSILFDVAQETGRMVLGTGNRTEICLGYTTWYGDSACSINPIGQLYKMEIIEAAKMLKIPREIIDKAPTADLWEGQTDEDEIGVRYKEIDAILNLLVEEEISSFSELKKNGFDETDISKVLSRLNRYSYKRNPAEVAPLGKKEIPDHIRVQE